MKILKSLQIVSLLVILLTPGCSLAIQRISEAEGRAHDYAVWILDERKSDRREVIAQRKAAIRDMEIGVSKMVAEGKTVKALAAREEIIVYIQKHTPSVADAIANIKALFSAVGE